MCKFNSMCQEKEGTCNCCEPSPFIPQVVSPVLPSAPAETALLYHLYALIMQQNEVIRTLADQTLNAIKKVESLSKGLDSSALLESPSIALPNEEVASAAHIMMMLCGNKSDHPFSLRLISEVPQPAYKERAFSLMVEVVDKDGAKVTMPIPVNLKILLFTTETPPKLMKVNTSGDKIMRGTVEVESCGVALFRKIVIKEVTSHFRNGCFFLVVMPKNSDLIKPLIIENFVIKARKIFTTEPGKKVKSENPVEECESPQV